MNASFLLDRLRSATSSSVEAGSAASSAAGLDDPVDGSEPVVLQFPCRAETTNQRRQQAHYGKTKLTAWCWRFVATDTVREVWRFQ